MAEALISGISAGFLEGARSEAQEEGGRIHFNFAFDENVFKDAYNQLRRERAEREREEREREHALPLVSAGTASFSMFPPCLLCSV